MANDDTIQQLEQWKIKYYKSLADLEQQQGYDELLQRSLGRLALAAQGLDPALDTQLKSLRGVLKGKSDHQEIELILQKMERAIGRMDTDNSKNQSIGEIFAELLTSLHLPKQLKSESKTLIKHLKSADDQAAKLVPEVLSLLDKCINLSAGDSASGFSFNLFGKGKSKDDGDDSLTGTLVDSEGAKIRG